MHESRNDQGGREIPITTLAEYQEEAFPAEDAESYISQR